MRGEDGEGVIIRPVGILVAAVEEGTNKVGLNSWVTISQYILFHPL